MTGWFKFVISWTFFIVCVMFHDLSETYDEHGEMKLGALKETSCQPSYLIIILLLLSS